MSSEHKRDTMFYPAWSLSPDTNLASSTRTSFSMEVGWRWGGGKCSKTKRLYSTIRCSACLSVLFTPPALIAPSYLEGPRGNQPDFSSVQWRLSFSHAPFDFSKSNNKRQRKTGVSIKILPAWKMWVINDRVQKLIYSRWKKIYQTLCESGLESPPPFFTRVARKLSTPWCIKENFFFHHFHRIREKASITFVINLEIKGKKSWGGGSSGKWEPLCLRRDFYRDWHFGGWNGVYAPGEQSTMTFSLF